MTILTMTYYLLLSVSFASLWPMLLLIVVLLLLAVVLVQNHIVRRRVRQSISSATSTYEMMEKALQIADNDVVYYDIPGGIIRRLRGSLLVKTELKAENFRKYIHPEDVERVLNTVYQLIDGKQKSVEYGYRWNTNYDGGEPHWLYLRNNSVAEYAPGSMKPVSIISVLVDETEMIQQQQEEEELAQRYKQIFEDSRSVVLLSRGLAA